MAKERPSMALNRGMLVKVLGGLLDDRLVQDERIDNFRYLQLRFAASMLGTGGDWAYLICVSYVSKYRQCPSFSDISALFEGVPTEIVQEVTYCLTVCTSESACTVSQFRHAVNHLELEHNKERFLKSLSSTLTIYQRGVKVKGKTLKGYKAAKQYLVTAVRRIEEKGSLDEFTNLRNSSDVILQAESSIQYGIRFETAPCPKDQT